MASVSARRSCSLGFGSGVALLLALPFLSTEVLEAASFNVNTIAEFQPALTAAQANGENDVIHVGASTFNVSSTLTYVAAEDRSLSIVGAGMASTILDGGDSRQIFVLTSSGANADLHVEGLTLRNGLSSTVDGGALHFEAGAASVTLLDCEITDSAVTGNERVGGGASVFSESGTILVDHCFFRRNTSEANVGGFFGATDTGAVTISDSLFEDNSVDNVGGSTYFGDGGGAMIYSDGMAQATVTGSTFLRNSATGGDNPDGGGLMVYLLGAGSTATVETSSFDDNDAGLGGAGLFMRLNAGGELNCRQNDFDSNVTVIGSGAGAFLYIEAGTLDAADNTCELNEAGEDGGGIWIQHGSGSGSVTGNRFTGNIAGNNGGGLILISETASYGVTGNIFEGNAADDLGGVGGGCSYATTSGSVDLARSTFYGNSASGGGGLYVYFDQNAAETFLTDLILWQDSPDAFDYSSGSGTGTLEMRYSDVDGGTGQAWLGEGCLDTDPLFEDAPLGDFRLQWPSFPDPVDRSPCIDSGDPASLPDADGTRADMGALPFSQGDPIFLDGFESGDVSAWTGSVG